VKLGAEGGVYMARLKTNSGVYLDIKPIAYEFPNGGDSPNWLQIQILANDGKYKWQAVDPAFENFELTALVEWIRQLVNKNPNAETTFYATEPCVEFEASCYRGRIKLKVSLGYGFLPPEMREAKDSYKRRVTLIFEDDEEEFLQFASDLERDIEPFPIRKESLDEE
jgi:hypothetical protein